MVAQPLWWVAKEVFVQFVRTELPQLCERLDSTLVSTGVAQQSSSTSSSYGEVMTQDTSESLLAKQTAEAEAAQKRA